MADFWDSAAKSFTGGVALGVRTQENAADREEREKYRAEQKERYDKQDARAQESHDVQMEEYDEKKEFKKIKSSFNAFHAMYTAGVENEDMNMQRSAATGLANLYNSKLPNGDEVKIIFKGDSAGNPELSAKWASDEKLKDKDVAVLSKTGGVMPFKNLDDVFKFAASGLSMENFTAGRKQAEAKVADLNNSQKPRMGKDGQYYIDKFKMGPGGLPQKETVPYEGVVDASKLQQDITEGETVLGRKMTSEEKRVKTGLSKPESPSERIAAQAALRKAAAGDGEGGPGKVDKKGLDKAKASLDMLLRPFVKKGKPILDPETGEMTEAADNALNEAGKLIDKAKEDSNSLTKEERRNLPHAVRAHEVFKAYSAAITASVISPEQAAKMAEGEGPKTNYKDGNWHVIPSGKDQGKEARWNGKKYELRERGGASAGFESEENETPPMDEEETPPPPAPMPAAAKPKPTATQENATRAGLIAGNIGANREKSALENLTTEDLAEAGRAALAAVSGPFSRVKSDYDEQKKRSGR